MAPEKSKKEQKPKFGKRSPKPKMENKAKDVPKR